MKDLLENEARRGPGLGATAGIQALRRAAGAGDLRFGPGPRVTLGRFVGVCVEDVDATGFVVELCELRRATLRRVDGRGAVFAGCSFRDAVVEDSKLVEARFHLCDLGESRWLGVDMEGATLVAIDWSFALLERVKLRGADLRGADLHGACLIDVDLTDADLRGADFRGALGFDKMARAALQARGAKVGGPSLALLWAGVLPGVGATHWRRVRRATSWTWAALALLLPALFFGRAILHPVDPDNPPQVGQ